MPGDTYWTTGRQKEAQTETGRSEVGRHGGDRATVYVYTAGRILNLIASRCQGRTEKCCVCCPFHRHSRVAPQEADVSNSGILRSLLAFESIRGGIVHLQRGLTTKGGSIIGSVAIECKQINRRLGHGYSKEDRYQR